MTYCLGILLPDGLILGSDSRTNAGVDQIAIVRKLACFATPQERVISLLSAGNLATTQAVVTHLRQEWGQGNREVDLQTAATLFDAANMISAVYRTVLDRDAAHVKPYGDASGSFLIGGQIAGEPHRLFQMYPAGNFIEATPRTQFVQIGETKYGKPILDRALRFDSSMEHAAKLALISFDATIRSNLSVAPPIDLMCYRAGSFHADNIKKYKTNDPDWQRIREAYSTGLMKLLDQVPDPEI